jgi:hypothetical protein
LICKCTYGVPQICAVLGYFWLAVEEDRVDVIGLRDSTINAELEFAPGSLYLACAFQLFKRVVSIKIRAQ